MSPLSLFSSTLLFYPDRHLRLLRGVVLSVRIFRTQCHRRHPTSVSQSTQRETMTPCCFSNFAADPPPSPHRRSRRRPSHCRSRCHLSHLCCRLPTVAPAGVSLLSACLPTLALAAAPLTSSAVSPLSLLPPPLSPQPPTPHRCSRRRPSHCRSRCHLSHLCCRLPTVAPAGVSAG